MPNFDRELSQVNGTDGPYRSVFFTVWTIVIPSEASVRRSRAAAEEMSRWLAICEGRESFRTSEVSGQESTKCTDGLKIL